MRRPSAIALLLVLSPFAFPSAQVSPPPDQVELQLRLLNNQSMPVNGAVSVEARIYDQETGGSALWTETHAATAQSGVVSLRLGSLVGFPSTLFDNGTLFLTYSVDAEPEMTPRRELASVPFTIRARRVAELDATTDISDEVIRSEHICDGDVRLADIDANAVDSMRIVNGGVALDDIAAESVDSLRLCDGSVSLMDMNAEAVDSNVLCDGSVSLIDMNANAVDSNVICDGGVSFPDIDPTGAVAGSVLTFDGLLPSWAAPNTLTLPYSQSTSHVGSAFSLNNSAGLAILADGLEGGVTGRALGGAGAVGVLGEASSQGLFASYGVRGVTESDLGAGVHGQALDGSGAIGVFGEATASGAIETYGVRGLSASALGAGVFGLSQNTGVRGEAGNVLSGGPLPQVFGISGRIFQTPSSSDVAAGLYGEATDVLGDTYGVYGLAEANDEPDRAYGVYGEANRAVGSALDTPTYGVYGRSTNDNFGIGVYGESRGLGVQGRPTDLGFGTTVLGNLGYIEPPKDRAHGVFGLSQEPDEGEAYGVRGEAVAQTPGHEAAGVSGVGSGPNSATVRGVHGRVFSGNHDAVFAEGALAVTGSKQFVQPHPGDPAKEIRFVSLEGNESGTYFRGSARLEGGVAVIEVPEAFRLASEAGGLTVQVTAIGAPVLLWIESKDLERVVVRGQLDVEFDYFVNGVRRGFADFEPVRPNTSFRPRAAGVPYGTQYPEALRQVLVENGILNPDGTPNETTAALLGWELVQPEAGR